MNMTLRHGRFLLDGLRAFTDDFAGLGVTFDVLRPSSPSAYVGKAARPWHPTASCGWRSRW